MKKPIFVTLVSCLVATFVFAEPDAPDLEHENCGILLEVGPDFPANWSQSNTFKTLADKGYRPIKSINHKKDLLSLKFDANEQLYYLCGFGPCNDRECDDDSCCASFGGYAKTIQEFPTCKPKMKHFSQLEGNVLKHSNCAIAAETRNAVSKSNAFSKLLEKGYVIVETPHKAGILTLTYDETEKVFYLYSKEECALSNYHKCRSDECAQVYLFHTANLDDLPKCELPAKS